jgi:tRNA dimethylallyltransferase
LYQGFDIGSAKPSPEERALVPHELFDSFKPDENCDAAIYAAKAKEAIVRARSRGQYPIVVGGTGLYLRALLGDAWDDDVPSDQELRKTLAAEDSMALFERLRDLDPARAAQLHPNDRFRVIRALEINILTGSNVRPARQEPGHERKHYLVFMNPPRDLLYERINTRAAQMARLGLLDEVRGLLRSGVSRDCKPMGSIGYKEALQVIDGILDESAFASAVATATRQYAKRQVTWFKKVTWDAMLSSETEAPGLIQRLRVLL